jgi:hypothetical protein
MFKLLTLFFVLFKNESTSREVAFPLEYAPSFEEWSAKYGKSYAPTERDYRNSIYDANIRNAIYQTNSALTVNQFTDLTEDELSLVYQKSQRSKKSLRGYNSSGTN